MFVDCAYTAFTDRIERTFTKLYTSPFSMNYRIIDFLMLFIKSRNGTKMFCDNKTRDISTVDWNFTFNNEELPETKHYSFRLCCTKIDIVITGLDR
jgi:hypothetical protein